MPRIERNSRLIAGLGCCSLVGSGLVSSRASSSYGLDLQLNLRVYA